MIDVVLKLTNGSIVTMSCNSLEEATQAIMGAMVDPEVGQLSVAGDQDECNQAIELAAANRQAGQSGMLEVVYQDGELDVPAVINMAGPPPDNVMLN